jgi:hypothetical protein
MEKDERRARNLIAMAVERVNVAPVTKFVRKINIVRKSPALMDAIHLLNSFEIITSGIWIRKMARRTMILEDNSEAMKMHIIIRNFALGSMS